MHYKSFLIDYGLVNEEYFDDEEVSEVRWVKYGKMEEFRKKYAKAPLKKDDLTFEFLRIWLEKLV